MMILVNWCCLWCAWHPDMDMRWCGSIRTARLAVAVQGTTPACTPVRGGATYDIMTKMKISAIIILLIIFNHRDLVRDQDEVYIYAT